MIELPVVESWRVNFVRLSLTTPAVHSGRVAVVVPPHGMRLKPTMSGSSSAYACGCVRDGPHVPPLVRSRNGKKIMLSSRKFLDCFGKKISILQLTYHDVRICALISSLTDYNSFFFILFLLHFPLLWLSGGRPHVCLVWTFDKFCLENIRERPHRCVGVYGSWRNKI